MLFSSAILQDYTIVYIVYSVLGLCANFVSIHLKLLSFKTSTFVKEEEEEGGVELIVVETFLDVFIEFNKQAGQKCAISGNRLYSGKLVAVHFYVFPN